jgi:drug/metabolite transporter (DMT)-like permease
VSHRRALFLMLVVTLLWSTAGVVSRQLDSARSLEVTFWRSTFTVISLLLWWGLRQGRAGLAPLFSTSAVLWASAACWAVMFTAFMAALTLTTVANVLVVMALGPFFTALLARLFLSQALEKRTVLAVLVAGAGVAWMFSENPLQLGWGPVVAMAVPLAAAINWVVLQRNAGGAVSLAHPVALGALLSALGTLPFALPFGASASDLAWLALLGATQLALPCVMLIHLTKVLSATEISLMALLELLFGISWAWWLANEAVGSRTLLGGGLVLAALLFNEIRRPPVALRA